MAENKNKMPVWAWILISVGVVGLVIILSIINNSTSPEKLITKFIHSHSRIISSYKKLFTVWMHFDRCYFISLGILTALRTYMNASNKF